MIYCIVGTHSTGKSTLIEELKKEYPSYYFNNSSTRDVTSKEERRLDVISDETQRRLFENILIKEKELDNLNQDIWMDRSFVDFLAYTSIFNERGLISDEFVAEMKEQFNLRVKAKRYDILFYLPIEFKIVDDGVRSVDPDLQKQVDIKIQEYLKPLNNVITLTGTVNDRITQIKSYVSR